MGLILGGALTQYLSWRYTLYVNLVFAVIAIAGALAYIHSTRSANPPRMDWPGAILACVGLFLIVFGFSHADTAGWTATLTIGSLVVGVVVLAGFVLVEQRVSHPLLPLRVVLNRTRGGAYMAVFLSGIAIFGVFLFLTYYMQLIKGDTPFTTGLLFLPLIGCILISSNLSSIVLLPRVGPRGLIAAGMLLGVIGMVYLTQITVTASYLSAVLPALLVLGLGFGMIFAPAINTATAGVRREDSGVASALVNTGQQVGGSIGTSALSTIALTATTSYLAAHHTGPAALAQATAAVHGYTLAFAVSAGILGVGVILAITLLPSRHRLEELRNQAAAAASGPAAPAPAPAPESAPGPASGSAPVPAAEPVAARTGEPAGARTPEPAGARTAEPVAATHLEAHAIPVALLCCSPVINTRPPSAPVL